MRPFKFLKNSFDKCEWLFINNPINHKYISSQTKFYFSNQTKNNVLKFQPLNLAYASNKTARQESKVTQTPSKPQTTSTISSNTKLSNAQISFQQLYRETEEEINKGSAKSKPPHLNNKEEFSQAVSIIQTEIQGLGSLTEESNKLEKLQQISVVWGSLSNRSNAEHNTQLTSILNDILSLYPNTLKNSKSLLFIARFSSKNRLNPEQANKIEQYFIANLNNITDSELYSNTIYEMIKFLLNQSNNKVQEIQEGQFFNSVIEKVNEQMSLLNEISIVQIYEFFDFQNLSSESLNNKFSNELQKRLEQTGKQFKVRTLLKIQSIAGFKSFEKYGDNLLLKVQEFQLRQNQQMVDLIINENLRNQNDENKKIIKLIDKIQIFAPQYLSTQLLLKSKTKTTSELNQIFEEFQKEKLKFIQKYEQYLDELNKDFHAYNMILRVLVTLNIRMVELLDILENKISFLSTDNKNYSQMAQQGNLDVIFDEFSRLGYYPGKLYEKIDLIKLLATKVSRNNANNSKTSLQNSRRWFKILIEFLETRSENEKQTLIQNQEFVTNFKKNYDDFFANSFSGFMTAYDIAVNLTYSEVVLNILTKNQLCQLLIKLTECTEPTLQQNIYRQMFVFSTLRNEKIAEIAEKSENKEKIIKFERDVAEFFNENNGGIQKSKFSQSLFENEIHQIISEAVSDPLYSDQLQNIEIKRGVIVTDFQFEIDFIFVLQNGEEVYCDILGDSHYYINEKNRENLQTIAKRRLINKLCNKKYVTISTYEFNKTSLKKDFLIKTIFGEKPK